MARPGKPAPPGETTRKVPTSRGGAGKRNLESAKLVPTKEAAALLGVYEGTIRVWRDQGCPGIAAGGLCNVALIANWDKEREAERVRKEATAAAVADGQMDEKEIARKRQMIGLLEDQRAFALSDGRFIKASVVEANTGRMFGRVAAELLTLWSRIETDMAVARDDVERRTIWDDAVKAIIVQMRVEHLIHGDPGQELEGMADEDVDALFKPTDEQKAEMAKLDKQLADEAARAERTDY